MFFIIPCFFVFFIVSYVFEKLFWRDYKQLNFIIYIIGIVGIIIHELSHYIAALLSGIKPKSIGIRLRSQQTGEISPNGYVAYDMKGRTFMQTFVSALAPLFFGTWIFLSLLPVLLSPEYNDLIRILAGFICFSLLAGMKPSTTDLKNVKNAFYNDIRYSLYQTFLVILSGFLIWIIIFFYQINLLIDIIYYLFIGIFYYLLKYSFMGINKIVHEILIHGPNKLDYKKFTRKRYKPVKPRKLGIEEPHW